MSDVIEIGMGELQVTGSPAILTTSGIGSCIAICLYSSSHRIGGLAHIMLPRRLVDTGTLTENDYRYADVAVALMVDKLQAQGVLKASLTAKIVGGANMFPEVQGRSQRVGEKNIIAVREILTEHQIRIAGEHVGGTVGRAITFDLGNGIVSIKINI